MTTSTVSTKEERNSTSDTQHLRLANALSELYRALKSVTFYPERHPLREENRQKALAAINATLPPEGITLEISRNGFVLAAAPLGGGDMVRSLAHELFVRRVRSVTLLPDMARQDLETFLNTAAMDPLEIAKAGGVEKALKSRGVTTIKVIDLTVIGVETSAAEETWKATRDQEKAAQDGNKVAPSQEKLREQDLRALIAELDSSTTDAQYIRQASLLAQKVHEMKRTGKPDTIIPAVLVLMLHVKEERRSPEQRECALFTLDQVASGSVTEVIIHRLQTAEKEQEAFFDVVRLLGSRMASPLLQKLVMTPEGMRRAVATALVRIGYPAVPTIISYIDEKQAELNPEAIAILGDIGSEESIPSLRRVAHRQDGRVAQEAIRAIAKIGGNEAETALTDLCATAADEKMRLIIYLLGIMKSRSAVPLLVDLLLKKDTFLRNLEIKKETAYALGRIGDPRVTPILTMFAGKRSLIARKRWEHLKLAIIAALVFTKDPSAIPALKKLSKRGRLREACRNAIKELEEASDAR